MATSTFIGLGLLLVAVLAGLLAWKRATKPAPEPIDQPRVWVALDRRVAELKAEISKAKASKKRHSHLQAELQQLVARRLIWERGA